MRKDTVYRVIDMAAKVGFVAFGWMAIWTYCGIAEYPSRWWVYVLASIANAIISLAMLGISRWAYNKAQVEALRRMQEAIRKSRRQGRRWYNDQN